MENVIQFEPKVEELIKEQAGNRVSISIDGFSVLSFNAKKPVTCDAEFVALLEEVIAMLKASPVDHSDLV